MQHDDGQIGRVLTRREAVALIGASGFAIFTGSVPTTRGGRTSESVPGCVVRPAQTEGPYFVDERLNRSDIRSDPASGVIKPGTPLDLAIEVSRVEKGDCLPVPGAQVDICHCDALGVYSDVNDPGFSTVGQKFLRGYQATDAAGVARFRTIYPGWYEGRTVHIHFKIRTQPHAARGGGHEFTSQVYFDDALSDAVYAKAPYAAKGRRTARNGDDGIFRSGGSQLLLAPKASGAGYTATFAVALELT